MIQVHYNLADPDHVGESDQTRVRLKLRDRAERLAIFNLEDQFLETLDGDEIVSFPAGQASTKYEWTLDMGDFLDGTGLEQIALEGLFSHMHEFGTKLQLRVEQDSNAPACMGDVQSWDFDWQRWYFYQSPTILNVSSKLHITCDYDTTATESPVYPGWGTQNEMCLAGLFLTIPMPPS